MKNITATELKQKLDQGEDLQLIDVREEYEHEIADIGGDKIPMGVLNDSIEKIAKDKPVVVYCHSGNRSSGVCSYLEENYGFNNLYNLTGGILAWADEVDPSMTKY